MKRVALRLLAGPFLAAVASAASAAPITITEAGYWLENIGANSFGTTVGPRTLFYATTNPGGAGGTTASARFGGTSTYGPSQDGAFGWLRVENGPLNTLNLNPLTVDFANGADTNSFTGQSLANLQLVPLAYDLAASGDPFSPIISWTLPTGPNAAIDRIQLVFYRTSTRQEIGSRVNLAPNVTSYDITSNLPLGFDITINVRLIDQVLVNGDSTDSNILRESRAYFDYVTPSRVPEPETALLVGAGLLGLVAARRRRAS